MGRPNQKKFVATTNVATASAPITTTQPNPTQIFNGFPVGDVLYKRLNLRLFGNLNLAGAGPAGTLITRGGLQFIRSLTLRTDKHNNIIDGLDGIMLHVMQTLRRRARPVNSDISSAGNGTPTYDYALEFDFEDPEAARPSDSALDLLMARPSLEVSYGVVGDFISGGTYTTESVQVATQELHVEMDPGGIAAKDLPEFMRYQGVLKVPINQTATGQSIQLSYGDRALKRLFVCQRNGSTLAELANTVIGANATDRVSLRQNSFNWVESIQWNALQNENANRYGLSAMPSGVAAFDFFEPITGGARISNALNVVSNIQGTLELVADVTSVSNGQLWIGYDGVKPLPAGAVRPASAPAA